MIPECKPMMHELTQKDLNDQHFTAETVEMLGLAIDILRKHGLEEEWNQEWQKTYEAHQVDLSKASLPRVE